MALASVPELPVGVRLLFQAAEELMPGGAIDAINEKAIDRFGEPLLEAGESIEVNPARLTEFGL
jgi:metal-dependent amidase/aminoacylase/carboxypeptidase family protein